MAERKRNGLLLLLEHVHTMEELTDAEFGQFIRAYAAYVEDGTEPIFEDRSMRMMWKTVRDFDEINAKRYSDTSKARQEAGRKGAESRWNCHNEDGKNSNCHFANSKNSLSKPKYKSKYKSKSSSTIVDSDTRADARDDLTTTIVFEEFRDRIGKLSETGKKELPGYVERLGADLVTEIIRKCEDLGGHSWAYVRKALAEAARQGCTSVEEYRKTNPIGAGRDKMVTRPPEDAAKAPDFLKNAANRRPLRKKGEAKSA
mgnify:FL=1